MTKIPDTILLTGVGCNCLIVVLCLFYFHEFISIILLSIEFLFRKTQLGRNTVTSLTNAYTFCKCEKLSFTNESVVIYSSGVATIVKRKYSARN